MRRDDAAHQLPCRPTVPRRSRQATGGLVFHVVNRGSRRGLLFDSYAGYLVFESLLVAAARKFDVEIFAYCLMPNHWHLLIRPRTDGALSRCMHWLTTTHARRWHLAHGTDGQGAVYQGRFKAIPVATDAHFLWVCRYVERNAMSASLVTLAEEWQWSSLWQRLNNPHATWLACWPVPAGSDWLGFVNDSHTGSEVEAFRSAWQKNEPFGPADWRISVMTQLGKGSKRSAGRPLKRTPDPITDL